MQANSIRAIISQLILLLYAGTVVQAQGLPFKGYIGANTSYSFQNNETSTSFSEGQNFTINSDVGFFINDKWAMGVSLGVQGSRHINEQGQMPDSFFNSKRNSITYGLGWQLRYYKPIIENKLFLFAQFDTGFGIGNTRNQTITEQGTFDTRSKFQEFSLGISPNLAYFISPKLAIEIGLAGLNGTYQWEEDGSRFTFNGGINIFNPRFGFRYYW